jgi:hypothetical protein
MYSNSRRSNCGRNALAHTSRIAGITRRFVFHWYQKYFFSFCFSKKKKTNQNESDSRPSVTLAGEGAGSWMVTLSERYEQALYPVFSLMTALLAEPLNVDVVRHVFEFVSNHSQAITDILQDGVSNPSLSSLRLLRSVVAVFSSLAALFHRPNLPANVQRQAAHFRELLLNLAHKYASFPDVAGDERSLEVLRLRQALLSYFSRANEIVFSPALKEDCSRPPSKNAASLSLLAFFLFQANVKLAELHTTQTSLDAQLQV